MMRSWLSLGTGKGTAKGKFAALEAAGVTTVKSPGDLGAAIAQRLSK
jgi:succinyl-CoA synthetase alpha subunit